MRRPLLLCLAVLVAIGAMGQRLSVTEFPKKPGDPLRYMIALESPVKGTVKAIHLTFQMTTGIREDQKGLSQSFYLSRFAALSPTEYEVEGSVPNVMSGIYLLNAVQLRTENDGTGDKTVRLVHKYTYSTDFKQENNITIENPTKSVFPGDKSVAPGH